MQRLSYIDLMSFLIWIILFINTFTEASALAEYRIFKIRRNKINLYNINRPNKIIYTTLYKQHALLYRLKGNIWEYVQMKILSSPLLYKLFIPT